MMKIQTIALSGAAAVASIFAIAHLAHEVTTTKSVDYEVTHIADSSDDIAVPRIRPPTDNHANRLLSLTSNATDPGAGLSSVSGTVQRKSINAASGMPLANSNSPVTIAKDDQWFASARKEMKAREYWWGENAKARTRGCSCHYRN